MSLEKRELQRRQGLRSQQTPEYQMEHHHSQWLVMDYPIYLGKHTINGLGNVQFGQILQLEPVSLMYAVKAEIMLTYAFGGPPDTFTLAFTDCAGTFERTILTLEPYGLVSLDISKEMEVVLKEYCSFGIHTFGRVSNVASPAIVYGAVLRFLLYKNDTFAGYEHAIDPLLILSAKTSKDYLLKCKKESKDFQYLSGLRIE